MVISGYSPDHRVILMYGFTIDLPILEMHKAGLKIHNNYINHPQHSDNMHIFTIHTLY